MAEWELRRKIEALADEWDMTGALAVQKGGTSIAELFRGAPGETITAHTRFAVARHAPFLLGYCAARMHDAGVIDLFAPLDKDMLGNFPQIDTKGATLLDALRNETEIFDYLAPIRDDMQTPLECAIEQDRLCNDVSLYAALEWGTGCSRKKGQPNQTALCLAVLTLEYCAGKPLSALEDEYVFRPLSMAETGEGKPDIACVLSEKRKISAKTVSKVPGAICTTPHDMALLTRALLTGQGLKKKTAKLLLPDGQRSGLVFERRDGMMVSTSEMIGFSCGIGLDFAHGISFFHLDSMPPAFEVKDYGWTFFRHELRCMLMAATLVPKRPRFVPYGEATFDAAMTLSIAEDQRMFILDPKSCLCRAYALGRRAKSFVLMEGEACVGLAVLLTGKAEEDNEIDALLIGESYQGRGFGKILLENCIAFYKKRGAASVTVALNAENDAALSLYESAGFAAVQDDGIEIEMRLTFD